MTLCIPVAHLGRLHLVGEITLKKASGSLQGLKCDSVTGHLRLHPKNGISALTQFLHGGATHNPEKRPGRGVRNLWTIHHYFALKKAHATNLHDQPLAQHWET